MFLRTRTYAEALEQVDEPLSVCQPTSWAADRFVRSLPGVEVLPARGFCTDRETFGEWAEGHRVLKLENFYRDARRRFDLLMDGNQPVQGRWNFDADNREPAPKSDNLGVTEPWRPDEDEIDEQVRADLDRWERDGRRVVRRPRRPARIRRHRFRGPGRLSQSSCEIACRTSALTRMPCSAATGSWHTACCRRR